MDRRRLRVVGLVVLVLGLFALGLVANYRRARFERAAPGWLNPEQPPDGVAAELTTLTADQSWAANRCRHMSACTPGQTAGARVRRTYPGSLAESPTSFVRARIGFELGGGE